MFDDAKIAESGSYYSNDDLLKLAFSMLKAARDGINGFTPLAWLDDNLTVAVIAARVGESLTKEDWSKSP